MKRLLVDVGNSRVKWAVVDAGTLGAMRVADAAALPPELVAAAADCADAVVVDVTDRLVEPLSGHVRVRRFVAGPAALGVTNGYVEPTRLGADRWAALLGARTLVDGACCIVDAGTALTFDVLAADGRHLGGWIAPGLRLSTDALARGTAHVRPSIDGFAAEAPARETARAVAGGAMLSALGFVSQGLDHARAALGGVDATLLVTGGDAAVIADAHPAARRIDDLVLRGLAAWAERH